MKTFLQIFFFFLFVIQICFAQWYQQASGITNDLWDVSFTDANYGWAVGYQQILRTTNGGTTWTHQLVYSTYYGVYFTDSNIGTVVGSEGKIIRTTNSGTNWATQTSNTSNDLYGVFFSTANIGTVVGANGTILRTTNGGTTWNSQTSGMSNDLEDVSFVNENIGWVVGLNGKILRTTNGGTTWNSQTSGTTYDLYGVVFINQNLGTAVGGTGVSLHFGIRLYTTNGGTTWNSESTGNDWLTDISFADANNGVIVGEDGYIIGTTNGGTSWNIQSSGTSNDLHGVSLTDANNGTAVGAAGTIVGKGYINVASPNGGEQWVSGNQYSITWQDNVSVNVKIELYKGGVFNSTIISSTTSNGTYTWQIPINQVTGSDYKVRISCVNSSGLYDESNSNFVISQPNILVTSPNGGEIWPIGTTQNITWTSQNIAFVKLEITRTNGATWTMIDSSYESTGSYNWLVTGNTSNQCKIKISDKNNLSIWDTSAALFSITDPSGIQEDLISDIPSEFNLYQNYPNPFNPSTIFRYSIPTQSKVVIKVYDVLGNEIALLMDEEKPAGTYDLTWYAVNLPSGVYFYQLKAKDFITSRRMLLLK